MIKAHTIVDLLEHGEATALAIAAPGREPMTYAALRALTDDTVEQLNANGVGRGDKVAIVLPNGPEMAAAFLTVAAGATTAPLNPAYRAEEFDFYLGDLDARALIVAESEDGPAVEVAERRGIQVFRLDAPADRPAGWFRLAAPGPARDAHLRGLATTEETALVLHTSGTTSRPKIVPLSQRNICASAFNIAGTIGIGPDDRCLNIMPLFHIHGLIAAVLSSLQAGGSVFCAPGFNALKFFSWIAESKPTWYTAVPTMHQAILARAERNAEIIADNPLKLIRSSSSSLPPQVMLALEQTFGVPVIESYGMTEAAHQMASNPLPPGVRKPGSVGPAAGPQIAILDPAGSVLPHGAMGEVCIRGDNVTGGYEKNAQANANAFTPEGWFRTGDQGVFDGDGYLTITGRLKEIINRGGEKVSPREVDEVLLDHPAVDQAVTFAMPHDKLGEDVAVAIVLKDGAELNDTSLRAFAAERLADFKIPRTVVFLDEIPKGATGKLQRIGLAAKLGLAP